jgi:hypothetical protein
MSTKNFCDNCGAETEYIGSYLLEVPCDKNLGRLKYFKEFCAKCEKELIEDVAKWFPDLKNDLLKEKKEKAEWENKGLTAKKELR